MEGGKKTFDNFSTLFNKKKDPKPSAANDDVFETIKKLSELKDIGVITQEEFDAKIAELLAKL